MIGGKRGGESDRREEGVREKEEGGKRGERERDSVDVLLP